MARSNVCSKPSASMRAKIERNTKSLFKNFSVRFLHDKSGVEIGTIKVQKCRLKISQEAAIKFCNIKEVKEAGFTKEILRPDLRAIDWIVA